MSTESHPNSRIVRIVCTSDTHNDVPLEGSIPNGDIFVHAGDMTDYGSYDELKTAYDWISALPHPVKIVIAGNHDLTLDPFHSDTTRETHLRNLSLFTSAAAMKAGIHYLCNTIVNVTLPGSPGLVIPIYGNPHQPEWLPTNYSFTYKPAPSAGSEVAWEAAPTLADNIPIWIMHGAPKGRLDAISYPPWPLSGCEVSARKVYAAKPRLCVFGHFHVSYGVERVEYLPGEAGGPGLVTDLLAGRADDGGGSGESDDGGVNIFVKDEGTKAGVFANVAWMTGEKRKVEKRNKPVVIDLEFKL
ncbi:Metallo-dependent phosphatase-like protein [Peziza echinospora]|nr:Metallo-dependent phosphatase-like protein [Peziza echinospora]